MLLDLKRKMEFQEGNKLPKTLNIPLSHNFHRF